MKKNINFLAIGDLATDAFIQIKDAETKCDINGRGCELCLDFGSKIPYEKVDICHATGNAANVAVAVSKLGLNSRLLSYVGNDDTGIKSLKELKKQKVDISLVYKIKNYVSNYHYVLWYKKDRTILTKHTEFPYSFPKKLKKPDWIYLSSLASNSIDYHKEIINYLNKNKDISLAFQPGTFQIKLGFEILKEIYKNTKIFLCNKEEAERILNVEEKDIKVLLHKIYDLGPKIVVITDSLNGSFCYDGKDIFFLEPYSQDSLEVTGAGDSYSAAFVTAIALGMRIEDALIWGSVNATSTVMKIGPQAGLMNRKDLGLFIKNINKDYKVKKIN